MQNYIEQFKNKMLEVGITPPSLIIEDGQIHRFPTSSKSKDTAGWYILHSDGIPAGSFGDWRTGVASTWCSKSKDQMSVQEWLAYCRLQADAKQKREHAQLQANNQARERACLIWEKAEPASQDHPYLLKKLVLPYMARQQRNMLVLPIVNFENEIQCLQFISPDGSKVLLSGGAKKGNFIPINKIENPKTILICEGFATGATLAASRPDDQVIAAIDAGNLKSVALNVRRYWPEVEILICADDDRIVSGNPGKTKAREAAIAAGARYTFPIWPEDAPSSLTDFNDLFNWNLRSRGLA
ncbi:MAG: toprim domain-containing protein [Gammaproteobacteria bacterium]